MDLKVVVIFGLAICTLILVVSGCFTMQKIGGTPEGARLLAIRMSPNYIDGTFRNHVPIPEILGGGASMSDFVKLFFQSRVNPAPPGPVPVVKTDLKSLDPDKDVVIWLGHSSYLIKLGGKTLLVDPVFSDYASPFFFSTRAFKGASLYTADDMPYIDALLISHDHWDHLDYATVMELKPKTGQIITGLGVGEHFVRWGFPEAMVHEADWDTTVLLDETLAVHVLPARHYSGRWLDKNRSLWVSFAVETLSRRIYYSGDSGYGPHFKTIGKRFDGFDLALLDSGQYNEAWRNVHMSPEQATQAAIDLNAKGALPSHAGKFSIAFHSWDDPFNRFVNASEGKPFRVVTPKIGELVDLADPGQSFSRWWE